MDTAPTPAPPPTPARTPRSPPSGKELLKEAGMDAHAVNDLPDFEEDAEGEDDIEYLEQNPGCVEGTLPNDSVES